MFSQQGVLLAGSVSARTSKAISKQRCGMLAHVLTCKQQRAALGIEPRTSHTLSENHATRPNSQVVGFLKEVYTPLDLWLDDLDR